MRFFITQLRVLWFRCHGGREGFLFHVATVPRPSRVTTEIRRQETMQSYDTDAGTTWCMVSIKKVKANKDAFQSIPVTDTFLRMHFYFKPSDATETSKINRLRG